MKLFHLVMGRMSLVLVLVLTAWAALFYMAVMEEVNDEVDDSLEDYAEQLMIRALAGEEMPSANSGTNNQYYLCEVSEEYARTNPHVSYYDEMVYIKKRNETEPARVLESIFSTAEGKFMKLVVYMPTIEKMDLQRAILGWMVFLYVTLLLVILGVNVWIYRTNMKPLYVLLKWLEHYRLGRQNEELVNDTRVTEFRQLNEAALLSVRRSEQLYQQQKLFIGNASHEMQTPLAICRNRLEMLMEDDSLSEKQLGELFKTHQTLENLTRLNRSLLLLCKIDNGQFLDTQEVCFNDFLVKYLDDYKEVYAYRKVEVSVDEQGVFKAVMNEALASVLFTNLLKNAFVHTVEGGKVSVVLTGNCFLVANSGTAPLDRERVFERFYQQGEKKEGSNGLGLALVKSVCMSSHLQVSYDFSEGMHRFSVQKD